MALHWERHRGVRLSSVSRAIALGSVAAVGVAACMTQIAPEPATVDNGRQIFRFDTFGNEQFWTDTLHLDRVVQSAVDPTTALGVGLKVDMDALPAAVVQGIQAGQVDLKSPATTVTLLKLNAVVALSPALTAAQKAVYSSWGPGMYDPRYNIDGKNTPLVIPPAYGLAQTNNETYTAEGPISYWNAYVAVTQMHGHGNFSDSRLGVNIRQEPDLVTPKLTALRVYQHSLRAPAPAPGSFDVAAAERGRTTFDASCARCHVGGTGTDNNAGVLHAPSETGMDARYAMRTTHRNAIWWTI